MYYPDGAYYAGEWSNNKKHGRGVLHFSDGAEKHGQWEMGRPVAASDRITRNSTEKVEEESPVDQRNEDVRQESVGRVAEKPDLTRSAQLWSYVLPQWKRILPLPGGFNLGG
jgi:hypothetical protein